MDHKSFSTKEALRFGWEILHGNAVFFLKILAFLVLISILPAFLIGKLIQYTGVWLGAPIQLLMIAWQLILGMGLIRICLKFIDRQTPEYADLWSCAPRVLNYAVFKIVFTLIVVAGLVLLVIPGLIWIMQFYMGAYLVIDRGLGPLAALKASSAVTRGVKWDLGTFTMIITLINLAGLILLGVGFLVTMPITLLASVYVYRQLLKQTEQSGQPLVTA